VIKKIAFGSVHLLDKMIERPIENFVIDLVDLGMSAEHLLHSVGDIVYFEPGGLFSH
jgi:hypothetical protein